MVEKPAFAPHVLSVIGHQTQTPSTSLHLIGQVRSFYSVCSSLSFENNCLTIGFLNRGQQGKSFQIRSLTWNFVFHIQLIYFKTTAKEGQTSEICRFKYASKCMSVENRFQPPGSHGSTQRAHRLISASHQLKKLEMYK